MDAVEFVPADFGKMTHWDWKSDEAWDAVVGARFGLDYLPEVAGLLRRLLIQVANVGSLRWCSSVDLLPPAVSSTSRVAVKSIFEVHLCPRIRANICENS